MPYGFDQFVRFVALIGFGILVYKANDQNKNAEMIIYGGLELLFQPFFKIALGREMWNIVDLIVGIGLIASLFMNRRKSHTHLQFAPADTQAKNCKRICLCQRYNQNVKYEKRE